MELGFLACGISPAKPLLNEKYQLENYLNNGYHGKMNYLEKHKEMRLNPAFLYAGTKSVISVLYNYFSEKLQSDPNAPILSKYAYGKDYHYIVKKKINALFDFIKTLDCNTKGRAFVDSAPVLEKTLARNAGLGWIGKNGILINRHFGSFFFIGELFVTIELDYNTELATDFCGRCTRCIEACPTQAIVSPGIVDARKCISYLTIELKDEIPEQFSGKMAGRVFGCDICQDVCPFNKKSKNHTEPAFDLSEELMCLSANQWYEMDEATFNELFRKSALKRTKFVGLKRNLKFLQKKD